jgi:hypothetical protein
MTPTVVVRTSVQEQVGGYRKELPHAGDMEMWLRFAAVSSVGFINAYQACHRMHCQNMSEIHFQNRRDLLQRRDAFRFFFADLGERMPESAHLKRTAHQSLSREALWGATKAFESQELPTCQAWLDLSLDIDPSIRTTMEWKRFQMKRLVGARVWKKVKPLVGLFRKSFTPALSDKHP